jgi:tight adherence protein B
MSDIVLLLLVFAAVAAGGYAITTILTGVGARRLRSRLDALTDSEQGATESVSAIRARYLRQLSPVERRLEELPGMAWLGTKVERAGWAGPAYKVAAISLGLGCVGAIAVGLFAKHPLGAAVGFVVLAAAPFVKLGMDAGKRMEKFDEQLPDALDLMTRSLRAGNPLMESFKFVSEEMKPPIAADFGRAWSNVNYGVSLKASLMDLLERTPSGSLRSLATAILVQRETGGNLAEILEKITKVMRDRARFQRRLRTLTAEGRMSGWVLGGIPFFLAGALSFTSPTYIATLFKDPEGQHLLMTSLVMIAVGAFWISRLTKLRV